MVTFGGQADQEPRLVPGYRVFRKGKEALIRINTRLPQPESICTLNIHRATNLILYTANGGYGSEGPQYGL